MKADVSLWQPLRGTAERERRRTSRPNLPKSVGWSSEVHRFDTSYFFPNVAATSSVDTSVLLDELVREIWAAQLLENKYDKDKREKKKKNWSRDLDIFNQNCRCMRPCGASVSFISKWWGNNRNRLYVRTEINLQWINMPSQPAHI